MGQPEDLQQQITQLTATVGTLSRRLEALEKKSSAQPTTTARSAAPGSAPSRPRIKSVTINPAARAATTIGSFIALFLGGLSGWLVFAGLIGLIISLVWPWTKKVEVAETSGGSTAKPSPVRATAPAHETMPRQPSKFEQDLAKHWFSWLGIISLVVGVTLLLNYAFLGLGPIGRVLTGYCAAGMLFGLWYWMRHMYRGFAFVLQSGAWAVMYISTYALHIIEGQPVSSAINAGILLLAVVLIITAAALWQKSKTLTVGAFFLGYITAFTNDVSTFTLISLVLLSIGAVAVASFFAWPEFIVAATFATYLVQYAWMSGQYSLSTVATTAAGLLILEVLVFGAAHWLVVARTDRHRQLTITGTIANLIGFYWLFNWVVNGSHNQYAWLTTIFIGVVCGLLAAATALTTTRRFLRPIYIVFAIGFITLGLSQKLHGDTLTLAYLIESAAVVCSGALMNERTVRYTGYVVSFIALLSLITLLSGPITFFGTTTIHARLVLGIFGALIMAINAVVLRDRKNLFPVTEHFTPIVFADIGLGLLLIVLGQELRAAWVPVAWSIMAFTLITYGAVRKSVNARAVSYFVGLFTAFYWLANVASSTDLAGTLNIHARLLSGLWVVVMYILSSYIVQIRSANLLKDESAMRSAYAWAAVIMLAAVLGSEVPTRLLSVAWGIEGVVLYIIGFTSQSLSARRQGLLMLGLTIGKVYLFDVQTLATPFKILSFIILGLILLGVGFLYNRWRQQQQKPVERV